MRMPATALATDLYDWLLFAHVLMAMVWVGGALLLNVLAIQALRARDPDAVARFVANLRVIGPRVFAPSVVLLLGFGIWLVIDSDAWDFGQSWIEVGLGLFVAAFAIGVAYLGRTATLAERAVSNGDHDQAARQLRRWSWGYQIVLVLLVAATWDMSVKPGL
jgi:uncharacterized membrane protein